MFKKHNIIKNREAQHNKLLQIIITGTTWTRDMKKFILYAMYNPFICIASFLEAIIFKSVHPQLYILKSIYKNQKISGKKTIRLVLMCLAVLMLITYSVKKILSFYSFLINY